MNTGSDRYSELDWLRVILILAVFLHHVFMPFNGDGWHVMNEESSKVLDDIMVYFEQVRLQTLFFIAGAGSVILLRKVNYKAFVVSKFHRLFVPLVFAMILVVPPQNYYENFNEYSSLADAYQKLVFSFEANHLWFVEFLFVFMILAVPVNYLLDKRAGLSVINRLEKLASAKHGLFALVLVIIFFRLILKSLMPSQSHHIENLSVSVFFFLFFLAGMCFINSPKVWRSLAENRKTNLNWFILSSVIFYAYYFKPDISNYVSLSVRWQLWWLVCSLVSWSALLVFMGYAIACCKNTPKWLTAANEMIYPFYILHQTAIVCLAFYIVQWDAGIAVKSLSLLFSALVVCVSICYFVIRPFKLTRYLFGLRSKA